MLVKIDTGEYYLVNYNTGKRGCLEVRREHAGAGTGHPMATPCMPHLGGMWIGKPVCLGEVGEDKEEACREQNYIWKAGVRRGSGSSSL